MVWVWYLWVGNYFEVYYQKTAFFSFSNIEFVTLMIKLLSFDKIYFMTKDLKRVDLYDGYICLAKDLAKVETKKAIRKYLKKWYKIGGNNLNEQIAYIELIRK